MFRLTKNPVFNATASLPIIRRIIDDANRRLADASQGLVFNADEHRYFLGGREMRSVSSIVEHFAPFDALATARRCAVNPKHEHFGKQPEEIVAIWDAAGREAADAGTKLHAFGEACELYLADREDEIDPQFRDRITEDGFVATNPKEEAAARWWTEQPWDSLAVVAKENRVVNPLLGYAGTFDLLLYDIKRQGFALKDYKTNKDLHRWFGDYLLPPLRMIRNNDIGKYTVQQTLYTIQLWNIGINVISDDLVWLCDAKDCGVYEEVPIDLKYHKVINWAVSQLNSIIKNY